MNQHPTTLIISAEIDTLNNTENHYRTAKLKSVLEDLNLAYKEVLGCYEYEAGNIASEISFVVPCNDQALRESLTGIMLNKFGQECVMELTPKRQAVLVYKDKEEFIGQFKAIDKVYADTLGVYTYDKSNGQYYGIL